jgi:Putative zinc finger in N-recognin (UBR box)
VSFVKCFRHSDRQGHEVYFHRTTPGGCCDCGDVEAWNVNGCRDCDKHRPPEAIIVPPDSSSSSQNDDNNNTAGGSGSADSANYTDAMNIYNNTSTDTSSTTTTTNIKSKSAQNPMETVYVAAKGQAMQVETITMGPTALPILTAALAVMIGAAVQCLVNAVDGAAIGADATQFRVRWM